MRQATRCAAPCRSRAPTRRRSRCGGCGYRPTTNTSWSRPTRITTRRSTEADGLKQIASFATKKSPMGFGFAADGKHAYLCCHDDAEVFEFELASGRVTPHLPDRGRLRVHRRDSSARCLTTASRRRDPGCWLRIRVPLRRSGCGVAHSPLMFIALMTGHHFSISAFCSAPSASGVC